MRAYVRNHEVWVFLFLIVTIQAVYVGGVATEILPVYTYNTGRFLLLFGTLAAVVFYSRGLSAVWSLFKPLQNWRVSPYWYVFALVWPPLVASSTLLVKALTSPEGFAVFELNFSLFDFEHPAVMRTVLTSALIGEVVWVSYAIGQLRKRNTLFVSSQIVGLFWALWWTPIAIFEVAFIPSLPILPLGLNILGVAATCAFVYHHAKSGLIVLVMQISLNSCALIFPILPTTGGLGYFWIFAASYFVFGVALHLIFGPKPLFGAMSEPSAQKSYS